MTRVVTETTVDAEDLKLLLLPRQGLVGEVSEMDGAGEAGEAGEPGCVNETTTQPGRGTALYAHRFGAEDGVVRNYRRTIAITAAADGRACIRQTVEYELATPFLGWLLTLPVRRILGQVGNHRASPWWAAPQRLDADGVTTLCSLMALAVVTGYLGTLLTQTVTFAAQEFGADKAAQGIALAVVRADIVFAAGLVALADRYGRRGLTLWAAIIGCGATAFGALSPSLAWLAASQIVARCFVTTVVIMIAVLAAEAMPRGSRAYALSLIAMAGGIGAGLCVLALPIAGIGVAGWRVLFAAAAAGIPLALVAGRRLPESRRYQSSRQRDASEGAQPAAARQPILARLLLLGTGAFLLNLFAAPASQFLNEYLRKERHFSASRISLFTILTVMPGALGIVVGGRLADVRGRRIVGAIGLATGVSATTALYLLHGWPMWAASALTWSVGSSVIPALGVYGPELFPTARRATANGAITGAGRIGGVIGLVAVGFLGRHFGRLGPAFALLAAGPVLLAALVFVAYPETAHRELEELNPDDAQSVT